MYWRMLALGYGFIATWTDFLYFECKVDQNWHCANFDRVNVCFVWCWEGSSSNFILFLGIFWGKFVVIHYTIFSLEIFPFVAGMVGQSFLSPVGATLHWVVRRVVKAEVVTELASNHSLFDEASLVVWRPLAMGFDMKDGPLGGQVAQVEPWAQVRARVLVGVVALGRVPGQPVVAESLNFKDKKKECNFTVCSADNVLQTDESCENPTLRG